MGVEKLGVIFKGEPMNTTTCTHEHVTIERACCTSVDPDTGRYSCACQGIDLIICDDCNELLEEEV